MEFKIDNTTNRIDGINELFKVQDAWKDFSSIVMTRFVFNLQSVSFVLRGHPVLSPINTTTEYILKIRCTYPKVAFNTEAECAPFISAISLWDIGRKLVVKIDNYAEITCSKAVVNLEANVAEEPFRQILM